MYVKLHALIFLYILNRFIYTLLDRFHPYVPMRQPVLNGFNIYSGYNPVNTGLNVNRAVHGCTFPTMIVLPINQLNQNFYNVL